MSNILIMMNNNFHDLATGLLLCAGVIMGTLERQARRGGEAERAALARALPALNRFALVALVWIVVGGIPRLIFFDRFERGPSLTYGWSEALVVKHVLLVVAVVIGAAWWCRLVTNAKRIMESSPED